jgi:hypothetical protein
MLTLPLLGDARAVAAERFISWRAWAPLASHSPATSSHRVSASAIKMSSWLKKTKNDHETSSSRGTHQSSMPSSPPPSTACPQTMARPPPAFLRPDRRITWDRGHPSTRLPLPRGSAIGATCHSSSASRSGWPTRASTTTTSASPAAGTSTVPWCRFRRRRRRVIRLKRIYNF